MLYVAVSVAHGCSYCIHSHTAGARAKGMTEAEYREMIAIIGMAAETNRLVTALGVPVDEAFLVGAAAGGGWGSRFLPAPGPPRLYPRQSPGFGVEAPPQV